MNIETERLRVIISYRYYCEKKKELESLRHEVSGYLSAVCCRYTCKKCLLLNTCKETGGFKELDE